MGALWAVLRGNYTIVRILRHWGTLDEGLNGLFLSEEGLFIERTRLINKTIHFEPLRYQDYAKEMPIEGPVEALLIADAEKHFRNGKMELITWANITGKKADPLFRDALQSALTGAEFLKQMKREKRVCLKSPGKVLFLCFTFCSS
jgi:hypothetical protein